MHTRADIIEAARTWLNTPYRHQGRKKGVYVDCIGLIWGVAQDIGYDRTIPANYAQSPSGGQLIRGCEEMLVKRPTNDFIPAGIGIFYGVDRSEAQHFCIFSRIDMRPMMIHAFSRHKKVVEHGFDNFWKGRLIAVYDYPDVQPEG